MGYASGEFAATTEAPDRPSATISTDHPRHRPARAC
jgi:hypothetical protein